MSAFTGLDLGVLVLYLAGVTLWGAWLGRGQTGATDYFLGSRNLPWWAVLLSVVATETSTLTFLSIPGVAYLGTLTFLQITVGYLLGRIVVAWILLPRYAEGRLTTAYQLLTLRFGPETRRFTSGVFMGTRLLADSVRLFATAIPLALITGWDYPVSIGVIGVLTVIYTYLGGIKAVVWVDALQMTLYLAGAVLAGVVLHGAVEGGWGAILSAAGEAGKLQVLDVSLDPGVPYTLLGGIFGGAFISMASHGADQLTVQRLLTCRDLPSSRRALVGSGFAVIVQFAVFLLLGLGLWAYYQGRPFERSDEIFARFIVEALPPGLTGLLIAGVFAAAMSSLSSSINALASASAYDFWAPLTGNEGDEAATLRAGKGFTLLWSALLVGGAIVFIPLSRGTSAVEVALAVTSLVAGGLLGAFALGIFSRRADSLSVRVGMVAGIGAVTLLWFFAREAVAWPWYAPLGCGVTVLVGSLLGRGGDGAAAAPGVMTAPADRPACFAGIDGGGTRTRVLLLDGELREIRQGEGPPGAVDPRNPGEAAEGVAALVRSAAEAAGVGLPITALWVGLAGAGRPEIRTAVQGALEAAGVAIRVAVGTDAEGAFHDAFGDGSGILLVSGTGSVAWGRSPAGATARVGGWGPLLGDEGSGYAMGVAGLRRVARAADGRDAPTALEAALLEALALAEVEELVAWAAGARRSAVAALAPVVARCAQAGDPAAGEILARAAAALKAHVLALAAKLGPWNRPPAVALAGGLLDPGGALRAATEEALRRHGLPVLREAVLPARGAARLAVRLGSLQG